MNIIRNILCGLFSLLWVSCTYLPLFDQLNPPGVEVKDQRDYIELLPTSGAPDPVGLMFWPGGLVDPHGYQASLGVFAARGYRVVIAKVPMNLAITQTSLGWDLSQRLGGKWVASGHSLGGTAAAWSVVDHPSDFQGLVLLGSYTTEGKPLRTWKGAVLSMRGEWDTLATQGDIDAGKPLLPPEGIGPGRTKYVVIPGGNHGQFGAYGAQDTDGVATISPQAQWTALANELELFWGNL